MDDRSSSDDDGLPDLMQFDLDELSRIRARNFMQHMLLTTAFFELVGTAALVGKMPRENWKIDRCSDLFYIMENSWPKYSQHLQDKLYIKHFSESQLPALRHHSVWCWCSSCSVRCLGTCCCCCCCCLLQSAYRRLGTHWFGKISPHCLAHRWWESVCRLSILQGLII